MLKTVRSLRTGARDVLRLLLHQGGGLWIVLVNPGPWIRVTLCKEGGNSDAAAVIDEGVDQHREMVGLWSAIEFYDKEGKHWGAIDRSAK